MTGIPRLVSVRPSMLRGELKAPPSKSVMQRVLALLLLRNASLEIRNAGRSADDLALLAILESAGFTVDRNDDRVMLTAPETQQLAGVDFRDSGLAARMLLPILATRGEEITVAASPQLRRRGLGPLIPALTQAGVHFELDESGWPASVRGPLRTSEIAIDGAFSSQPVTGLLYALAAGNSGARIRVTNAVSMPYIDLSLRVLEDLGFPLPKSEGPGTYVFEEGRRASSLPRSYSIEGDWSAAAFWLVAGAIAGPLRVTGLDAFTAQGDKAILQPLMDAGASLSIEAEQVTVRPAPLQAFHYDATDTPDLFPPLAVLGCFAAGQSVIEGVARLASKESNRAETIISELGKLGADIRLQDDLMIVTGTALHGGTVDAHGDHRIAMMAAIAALRASGDVSIHGADTVAKSYPDFFEDLQTLGGGVSALD